MGMGAVWAGIRTIALTSRFDQLSQAGPCEGYFTGIAQYFTGIVQYFTGIGRPWPGIRALTRVSVESYEGYSTGIVLLAPEGRAEGPSKTTSVLVSVRLSSQKFIH
jgi:hypothetical protein